MIELLVQAIRWQAQVNQTAVDIAEFYGMTLDEAVRSIIRPTVLQPDR